MVGTAQDERPEVKPLATQCPRGPKNHYSTIPRLPGKKKLDDFWKP